MLIKRTWPFIGTWLHEPWNQNIVWIRSRNCLTLSVVTVGLDVSTAPTVDCQTSNHTTDCEKPTAPLAVEQSVGAALPALDAGGWEQKAPSIYACVSEHRADVKYLATSADRGKRPAQTDAPPSSQGIPRFNGTPERDSASSGRVNAVLLPFEATDFPRPAHMLRGPPGCRRPREQRSTLSSFQADLPGPGVFGRFKRQEERSTYPALCLLWIPRSRWPGTRVLAHLVSGCDPA